MMMRWIAIVLFLCAASCTQQLNVLVQKTNYVQVDDFAGQAEDVEVLSESAKINFEQKDFAIDEIIEVNLDGEIIATTVVEKEVIEENKFAPLGQKVGVGYIVEELIGKVDGRPVFANAVLEPIEDKIRADLRRNKFTKKQFSEYLFVELRQQIQELVNRDLLLSEANAGISPEMAYGLFAVIGQMRKDYAAAQGGSSSQMRHLTEEQDGVTVDSFLESNREQILIEKLYGEKVWPNVHVTWRDIQRAFEKIYIEEFSSSAEIDEARVLEILAAMQRLPLESIPAARGSIVLGMIRLKLDDPQIATVDELFTRGDAFLEIAESVGAKNGGVWEKFELKEGGIASTGIKQIFIDGLLNSKADNQLFVHETKTSKLWFAVLEFNEPISLYNREIQIEVRNQLRSEQFNSEQNRFLQTIWGKHSMAEVDSMAARVVKIALQRYFQ